jgi:hypothetical protein
MRNIIMDPLLLTLIGVLGGALVAGIGAYIAIYSRFRDLDHKLSVKEKEEQYFREMKERLLEEIRKLDSESLKSALGSFVEELFAQTSVPHIHMGEVSLTGKLESNIRQKKEIPKSVKFPDNAFTETPKVHVSLVRIDLGGKIHRVEVQAREISKEGFSLVFKTWHDSAVYTARAAWIAIGK